MRFWVSLAMAVGLLLSISGPVAAGWPNPDSPNVIAARDSKEICDQTGKVPTVVDKGRLPWHLGAACNENTTLETICWWRSNPRSQQMIAGTITCDVVITLREGSLWVEMGNFFILGGPQPVAGTQTFEDAQRVPTPPPPYNVEPPPYVKSGVLVPTVDSDRCRIGVDFSHVQVSDESLVMVYWDMSLGKRMQVLIPQEMTGVPAVDPSSLLAPPCSE